MLARKVCFFHFFYHAADMAKLLDMVKTQGQFHAGKQTFIWWLNPVVTKLIARNNHAAYGIDLQNSCCSFL